jgi:predicted acetyltransferase
MRRYFRDVKKPRWYTLIIAAVIYIWQCMIIIPALRAVGGEYYSIIATQLFVGTANIMFYLIYQKARKKKSNIVKIIINLLLGTILALLLWDEPFELLFGVMGILGGIMLCISNSIVVYVLFMIAESLFKKDIKNIEALYLAEPNMSFEKEYLDMMSEWENDGGILNPAILKNKEDTYEKWLELVSKSKKNENEDIASQSLFFFIRNYDRKILGAISIRHELNETLLKTDGHISYGIRPSEREKGYATKMLSIAFKKAYEMGIEKVLITCDKDNIASEKVITKNGGILEDEITEENGNKVKRFWIEKEKNNQ